MHRRSFLKTGVLLSAGLAGGSGLPLLTALRARAAGEEPRVPGVRWGMVIELGRCPPGCTACVDACRIENGLHPDADPRWDVHRIRLVEVESTRFAGATTKTVPLLCNHCDEPPCVLACPIQATYRRPDGIVIVDPHRCMGCRYCMIACPYDARHFNFRDAEAPPRPDRPRRAHGVAESCDLCAHRLDRGQPPACVAACAAAGARAIHVGDLDDPDSEVSALLRAHPARRLREGMGTEPKVFYVGL